MAKPPDRVDTAIWQTAAASRVLLDSVPGVVSLLSSWATDVLQMPLKLEAYGSVVTGIADTSSDIDVVLLSDSLEDAASILARLYDAHERLPHFHVVRFLESARAPVLTVARADGLMVDITAGSCLPVYNSRLLKEYCELDHRLLPLACAIKRFAKVAGVVGAATHNLSSYAWSLMVVFYLQAANLKCYLPSSARSSNLPSLQSACRSCEVTIQGRKFDVGFKRLTDFPLPDAGRVHGSESLSSFPWRSLALGFFKFFLEDFDLDKEIISVCCGSRRFVDASTTGPGPHIRDPFDPGRDLGAVLSAPRREAFREALMVGRRLLEEKVAFAELLQGDADLCSPVQWDTLVHSAELQHHRIQPGGYAAIWRVGLLTGDSSVAPASPILVATTEILRSMLCCHHNDFTRLQTVVFDEVHYIGDVERGAVWEDCMILLPPHINVVCLSATVPNCLDLAGWICQTRHCVCHLILKLSRPVPLRIFGVADVTSLLVDGDNAFLEENFAALKLDRKSGEDIFQAIAANAKLTPTLAFMFSKVACETNALAVARRLNQAEIIADRISEYSDAGRKLKEAIKFWTSRKIHRLRPVVSQLLSMEARQRIQDLAKETLLHLPEEDRSLQQVEMLMDTLLPLGLAIHHSGLLAPLRELVERLCAEGLVLLLFCTETCAVGLNFPAKSVAFSFTKSGLLKCDGCNMRMVRTGEYQQMAGRAGRRGLDKHGNVLFCMSNRKDESEQKAKANAPPGMSQMMKQLILNSAEPVMSSYMLRFPLMLNLLKFGHAGYVKWLFLQTFRQFQSRQAAASIEEHKTQRAMFAILEALGFLSLEQRLTTLGRAVAGLWIGDPLLMGVLLRDKVLDPFPALELVSLLSVFTVEPKFRKHKGAEEEQEDEQSEDARDFLHQSDDSCDPEAGQFIETTNFLVTKVLRSARLVSDAYVGGGLVSADKGTPEEYVKNWRKGCLTYKQFNRLLTDGKNMVLATRMWITGKTFSEALHVARMDAGTFAKAIRKLGKLVRMLIQAALKLQKDTFADSLSRKLSCLMRGLPFLSPLLLRNLESSADVDGDDGEPLWTACPDEVGARVELKPSDIGFSHRSCSAHFQDGRTVRSTLTEILAGKVSPCDIEELRVFWHQGIYYTLGNRRLCVYRLLEHCRPNTKISVKVVSESEAEAWDWKDKFTSGRWKGAVVLLRHTGEIIGKSLAQSTFKLPSAEEIESTANAVEPHPTCPSPLEQPGAIGYWHHLRAACQGDNSRVGHLRGVVQIPGAPQSVACKAGPPHRLLDPLSLSDEQLARMDMDWSPCTDPRYEQPACGEGNGKPCTRKGCSGIFEKTGEPCQFCHAHPCEVIARFEAFRGFARRAAKKNLGKHANRRMGY
ncbi:Superkiller viralicidic activity 2-like 2 [Symbiodinium microadriaticum]|uniref:Superkiller viralicidic activity 2-like 2 n=1 Tax=Symbiodinium microadriaticum TaxID=2951 RepID=A0A1Q9DZ43_SYMMI|nr:Superkiller viralicidic activity 2-like 2 [Symbiodinium microadriaticum]